MNYSVIIPCYNRRDLIGDAIRSALEQTCAPAEIIVVDDGSSDGSADVAAGFGSKVHMIRQANAGAAAARNRGIREAKSEWIAFLDSDDTWSADKMEVQLRAVEEFPEADLVFCDTVVKDGAAVRLASRFALGGLYGEEVARSGEFALYDRSLFRKMLEQSRCITSAVMVRRRLPELSFPEHIWGSEDWALWLNLSLRYTLVSVDRILVQMHISGDNLTGNVSKLMRNDVLVLRELEEDPILTGPERKHVGRFLRQREIAALYHSLRCGETRDARRLLRELPTGALSQSRRLAYLSASWFPGQLLRKIAQWRA